MTTTTHTDIFTLSLRDYPSFNSFSLDLLEGSASAVELSSRHDLSRIAASTRVRDTKLASALISSNAQWGNDVSGAISRWASGGTLSIIAGQQVGFAGGPLYTLAKIASMLSLRESLRASGREATVFFWLATEDHDFDEVSHLLLQTRGGNEELRAMERSRRRMPVGTLRTPESLLRQAKLLFPDGPWLEEGLTLADSFARLLAEALRGREVVLVDSLLPELRRAGAPLLDTLSRSIPEIETIVDDRSREISGRGYGVPITRGEDGYSLLYLIDETGERQPVRESNAATFREALETSPQRCSTAALLRPLLQDFVFESDVFVGGPSEVAYYSQILPLHERLGVKAPHVAVRGHALVAPERVVETIGRNELTAADLFLPLDELAARFETTTIEHLESSLAQTWASMNQTFEEGVRPILEADPGLARSLRRSNNRMKTEMDRVTRRGRLAISRRDHERFARLQRLHDTLNPNDTPQDRVAGWITWWVVYGPRLIDRLVQNCRIDEAVCKVVSL